VAKLSDDYVIIFTFIEAQTWQTGCKLH